MKYNKTAIDFPKTDVGDTTLTTLGVYNENLEPDVRELDLPAPFEFKVGSTFYHNYYGKKFSNLVYETTGGSSGRETQTIVERSGYMYIAGVINVNIIILEKVRLSDNYAMILKTVSATGTTNPTGNMFVLDSTYGYLIVNKTAGVEVQKFLLSNGSTDTTWTLTDAVVANDIYQEDDFLYIVGEESTGKDGCWIFNKSAPTGSIAFTQLTSETGVVLDAFFYYDKRLGSQGTDTFLNNGTTNTKQLFKDNDTGRRLMAEKYSLEYYMACDNKLRRLKYRDVWEYDASDRNPAIEVVFAPTKVVTDFEFEIKIKTDTDITTEFLELAGLGDVSIYYENGNVYVYNSAEARVIIEYPLTQIDAYVVYDFYFKRDTLNNWTVQLNGIVPTTTEINPTDSWQLAGNFYFIHNNVGATLNAVYIFNISLILGSDNAYTAGFENTTTYLSQTSDYLGNSYGIYSTCAISSYPSYWTLRKDFETIEETTVDGRIQSLVYDGGDLFITSKPSTDLVLQCLDSTTLVEKYRREYYTSLTQFYGTYVSGNIFYFSATSSSTTAYVAKCKASDFSFIINAVEFDVRFAPTAEGSYAKTFGLDGIEADEIPAYGESRIPASVSEVRNSIIQMGYGYKDFIRYKSTPDTQYIRTYHYGGYGSGFAYNSDTGEFTADSSGRYERLTHSVQIQSQAEEYDVFFDTINLSFDPSWSDNVENVNIEVFVNAGVSHSKAEIFFTQDSNYEFPDGGLYQKLGDDEETSAFDNTNIYLTGTKQVELKETPTDARSGRSFKIRIKQRLTDDDDNACVDDVKVFHLKILSSEMLIWEGADNA